MKRAFPNLIFAVIVSFGMAASILAVTKIDQLEIGTQIQFTNTSGPTITTGAADPNGTVTQPVGSIRIRTGSPIVYQNLAGAVAWSRLDTQSLSYDDCTETVLFDGINPAYGIAPIGSAYTLDRDLCAGTVTVDPGVRIATAGHGVFVSGRLTNNGDFNNSGQNGVFGSGGQGGTGSTYGAGGNGGNGGPFPFAPAMPGGASTDIVGNRGFVSDSTNLAGAVGSPGGNGGGMRGGGGGGGDSDPGADAGATTVSTSGRGRLSSLIDGRDIGAASAWTGGSGGGGGGAGAFGGGGGGGGGGGWVVVVASELDGSGSFTAMGGNGESTFTGGGGGGAGGGGIVVLVVGKNFGTTTVNVTPGIQGTASGGGGNGGQAGGGGYFVKYLN